MLNLLGICPTFQLNNSVLQQFMSVPCQGVSSDVTSPGEHTTDYRGQEVLGSNLEADLATQGAGNLKGQQHRQHLKLNHKEETLSIRDNMIMCNRSAIRGLGQKSEQDQMSTNTYKQNVLSAESASPLFTRVERQGSNQLQNQVCCSESSAGARSTRSHRQRTGNHLGQCPVWFKISLSLVTIIIFGGIVSVYLYRRDAKNKYRSRMKDQKESEFLFPTTITTGTQTECQAGQLFLNGHCLKCPIGSSWHGSSCVSNAVFKASIKRAFKKV